MKEGLSQSNGGTDTPQSLICRERFYTVLVLPEVSIELG